MNRRGFLKLVGVIAGSLVLPIVPGGAVSVAGSSCCVTDGNVEKIWAKSLLDYVLSNMHLAKFISNDSSVIIVEDKRLAKLVRTA